MRLLQRDYVAANWSYLNGSCNPMQMDFATKSHKIHKRGRKGRKVNHESNEWLTNGGGNQECRRLWAPLLGTQNAYTGIRLKEEKEQDGTHHRGIRRR